MSDAISLCKDPNESLSDYNRRLSATCKENHVTDFQLLVVDGQPMVTLLMGLVEATEEDVEAAAEAPEPTVIKEGDLIPEDDPIVVQVSSVKALTPTVVDKSGKVTQGGDAEKTERRLEKLYERANGGLTKQINATGRGLVVLPDPNDPMAQKDPEKAKQVYVELTQTFVGIGYIDSEPEPATESDKK